MEDKELNTSWSEPKDQKELKVVKQKVPDGFIINSNVFLYEHQWHTLADRDDLLFQCAVCDQFVSKDFSHHITSEDHIRKLDGCKPLLEYELSIARVIGSNYHCAVCSIIFDVSSATEHFEGKAHERRLLSAINKVTDIMYNLNLQMDNNDKNQPYHFDAQALNNNLQNGNNNYGNNQTYHSAKVLEENLRSMLMNNNKGESQLLTAHAFNNNHEIPNKNNDNNHPYNFNAQFFENNLEFYNDYIWDSNGDEIDQQIDEPIDQQIDEPLDQPRCSSYATMARKAKTVNIPKVIEKIFDGRNVKVKSDSWHMIIKPSMNMYYCYVCKKMDHIKFKSGHCDDTEHLAKLDRCLMVNKYPGYFVRKLDNTFYHCGHCNRIQASSDIEHHLMTTHPKKFRNFIDESQNLPLRSKPAENGHTKPIKNGRKHKISTSESTTSSCSMADDAKNDVSDVKNNEIEIPSKVIPLNPSITDDIIIVPFNYSLKVKFLAFNVIFKHNGDFFCGLCHVPLIGDENLTNHSLFDAKHIQLLQQTLFVQDFSCNLIRFIGISFHCTHCNVPVNADHVETHVREIQHVFNLGNALGIDIKPNGTTEREVQTYETNAVTKVKKAKKEVLEPKMQFNEPKTKLNEPKMKINEPKTKINELMRQVHHLKTDINESKREVNEPITKINEFKTEVYEPKTEINEPKGEINEPHTDNTIDNKMRHEAVMDLNVNKDINKTNAVIKSAIIDDDYEFDNGYEVDDDEELDSDEIYFDNEELVYVKINKRCTRISSSSYNTIIYVGDGTRFCFVCTLKLYPHEVGRHTDCRAHQDNVKKYRYLENYEQHLFRQIFLQYHCAICNVTFHRRDIQRHINWPTHSENAKNNNITKKQEKNNIQAILANTEKEKIHLKASEPKVEVTINAKIVKRQPPVRTDTDSDSRRGDERLSKMVMINSAVVLVSWLSWNSFVPLVSDGNELVDYRCMMCKAVVKCQEVSEHLKGEWHERLLQSFDLTLIPALVRKLSDNHCQCVFCNIELSMADVKEHINGKKHAKVYNLIQEISSKDNYDDCMPDVCYL